MKLRDIRDQLNSLSDEQLEDEANAFVYSNGEMESINGVLTVGQNLDIDSHCHDINEGLLEKGKLYFLIGYGVKE